ncbi:MAG: hypothetical protein QM820_32290 [Minicystis sp.]
MIVELDEDARAWVQMQVDLGPPSSAHTALPVASPGGRARPQLENIDEPADEAEAALMRRAEDAIATYDYELAQGLLMRALAMSDGAEEPAAALLALLVETLGDDAGALAVEASLSRTALASPPVRALLALAAARSGDEARALDRVRGVEGTAAAAVFAALASASLGRGDVAHAEAHLAQARRLHDQLPDIDGLTAAIVRARSAARGPAEAEAARLLAEGRHDEAEAGARALLACWPESDTARRVLRAVEEQRRKADVERLLAMGEAALASGDAAAAMTNLGQALAIARGPERAGIEQKLRSIEAGERERREAEEVERVLRLLSERDAREGLAAYLGMDDAIRARVRAEGRSFAALRWLDLTGRGAPRARVEAVLALVKARDDADPEAVLAALAPHAALLERVPEARQLTRDAEARLAEQRSAQAMDELRAARAAFAAGGPAEVLRRLDEATLRDLPHGERDGAAALRADAARLVERARRGGEVEALRASGRLFEARALAEELAAEASGDERAHWEAERHTIQAEIQRELRVQVDDTPVPIDDAGSPASRLGLSGGRCWLTDEGRAFVLASEHARWVRVRVIDVTSLRARVTVILRAPEDLQGVMPEVRAGAEAGTGAPAGGRASTEETLWLIGGRGALLALSLRSWQVLSFRPASDLLMNGERVDCAVLASDEDRPEEPRALWFIDRRGGRAGRARVLDLVQRRLVREIHDVTHLQWLAGAPRVVCLRESGLALHGARGTALPNGRHATGPLCEDGVALHPSGRGLVAFVLLPSGSSVGLAWLEIPFEGAARPPRRIDGANGKLPVKMATSREAGAVFVIFGNQDEGWEMLALGGESGQLEPLYRLPVTGQTFLLQDDAARRVVAFQARKESAHAVAVGATPPAMPARSEGTKRWINELLEVRSCGRATWRRGAKVKRLADALRSLTPEQAAEMTASRIVDHGNDPVAMADLALALAMLDGDPLAARHLQSVLSLLMESHGDVPETRLLRASAYAEGGRWDAVREMLDGVTAASVDEGLARHFAHISTIAALWTGDVEGARAALEEGLLYPGHCQLDALAEIFAPPRAPVVSGAPTDAETPERGAVSLVDLASAIRAADRHLARGDARSALAVLDRGPFWNCREVQAAARFAEGWLQVTPETRLERFRKIVALSKFLEVHEEKRPARRREVPFPGAKWGREQLDEVAERAREWLENAPFDP